MCLVPYYVTMLYIVQCCISRCMRVCCTMICAISWSIRGGGRSVPVPPLPDAAHAVARSDVAARL